MAKKLAIHKIVAIGKAMEELSWWGKRPKWHKKIMRQLRKRLRDGA